MLKAKSGRGKTYNLYTHILEYFRTTVLAYDLNIQYFMLLNFYR